ncbi:transposase [Streptomyces sp. NPDC096057]|uniref:transposase n=1 Tax=Streptomyces sp. NPDC096057 TaxID=3155543 RepID=UPI0033243109
MKARVIADQRGRTLRADGLRPGRMHDVTAARTAGISTCFDHVDRVQVLLDDGYLALSRDHPRESPHPATHTATRSESALHRGSGTPATRPLLATNHRPIRPRRTQTLEATPALAPPPRPLPDTYRAIAGQVSDHIATIWIQTTTKPDMTHPP